MGGTQLGPWEAPCHHHALAPPHLRVCVLLSGEIFWDELTNTLFPQNPPLSEQWGGHPPPACAWQGCHVLGAGVQGCTQAVYRDRHWGTCWARGHPRAGPGPAAYVTVGVLLLAGGAEAPVSVVGGVLAHGLVRGLRAEHIQLPAVPPAAHGDDLEGREEAGERGRGGDGGDRQGEGERLEGPEAGGMGSGGHSPAG